MKNPFKKPIPTELIVFKTIINLNPEKYKKQFDSDSEESM